MDFPPPPLLIPPSSSSPNSLHSPEPSGTPDMKRVSSHRGMDLFGLGNEIENVSNDLDIKGSNIMGSSMIQSITGQRMENVFQDYVCSVSDVESKANSYFGCNTKRVERNSEQINFALEDSPSNVVPENEKVTMIKMHGDLDLRTIKTHKRKHLESENYVCDGQSPENKDVTSSALCSSAQKEQLVARMDANFIDLIEKVTSLQLDQLAKISNSISALVNDKRISGTIPELQKKIVDLKGQVMKQKNVKHAVAQQLSSFRRENVRLFQHQERFWEIKYRELQKEKQALCVRLKKLEMQSPAHVLAEGGDTLLTKENMKRLQQEIEEQETLIKGYQIENERAIENLREVELAAKEKEKKMAEEIAALSTQVACLQASTPQKAAKEDVYASLCESLSLKGKILDSQAREEILLSELEMVKNEKKIVEKMVMDLEAAMKIQQNGSRENLVPTSDVSSQCMLITDCMKIETHGMSEELENKTNSEYRKFENHGNKENIRNVEGILKVGMEDICRKFQSLQKKMEKLKREHEIRIRELKQKIQKKTVAKGFGNENVKKVNELEIQIREMRAFYTKKIQDLKEKLTEKQTPQKQLENKLTRSNSRSRRSLTIRKLQEKVTLLENITKEKSTIINDLEEKILERKNEEDRYQPDKDSGIKTKANEGNVKNSSCNPDSVDLKEARDFPNRFEVMNEKGVPLSSVTKNLDLNAIQDSQKGKDEEILMPKKHHQVSSRVCANCAQVVYCIDPNQELLRKSKTFHASPALKLMLAKSSHDIGCNTDYVTRNEDVNHDIELKHSIEMELLNPDQQLQVLRKKVLDMEARQNQREHEWKSILSDTKRLFHLEHDMTQRKWELAMEAKNAEIERFKLELDTILEAAIKIQQAQFKFKTSQST